MPVMDIRTYALKHGGFPRVAESLGFNAEYLRQVAKGRRRFSPKSAVLIEHATCGAITREDLRPDIFRRDHPATPTATPVHSAIPDSSICPRGHSE